MNVKIVVLGGGLSGGLTALYLKHVGFEDFVLLEKSPRFGGDHTWSYMNSDLVAGEEQLLNPLTRFQWPQQQVKFPQLQKTIPLGYNSIRSEDFHKHIVSELKPHQYRLNADSKPMGSALEVNGELIKYELLLDARGAHWSQLGPCGFQKFVGQDVHFKEPHGISNPIIMDAQVVQKEGYRFLYTLPLSPNCLLIEDTRYSNDHSIEEKDFFREIQSYAQNFGEIESMGRSEKASLALPLTDKMFDIKNDFQRSFTMGLRGGFFHPITGYSFPIALRVARTVAQSAVSSSSGVLEALRQLKILWKKECRFLFILNRMLFGAAQPDQRYVVFEHFYGASQSTIERFYRGELVGRDKVRLLSGRPPVAVHRAVKSLVSSSWMNIEKNEMSL